MTRISQLFDKYVQVLTKSITGPTEDDNLTELKEPVPFKAETDSQQLALLGTAFTIAEELLPMVVSRIWNVLSESKEAGNGVADNLLPSTNSSIDPKEWRRQLQHSLDKLRDHFCRQYVLTFIYSRDGEARLDAQIYLGGEEQDLIWDSDPHPSLPFQVFNLSSFEDYAPEYLMWPLLLVCLCFYPRQSLLCTRCIVHHKGIFKWYLFVY